MKQILPAFLALLLVLCVLGACGENSLPSSKNAPGQGSLSNVAETPEPTEPAGRSPPQAKKFPTSPPTAFGRK